MKSCIHCGEKKPLADFYKHPMMADGHINVCKPCRDAYVKQWNAGNLERRRKIGRESAKRRVTPEYRAKIWARHYAKAKGTTAYLRMVQRVTKRQRLICGKATPSWNVDFFIEEAYDLARRRTLTTGIRWQVDHIVPLQSALVCGLHVHDNLAVIPALQNLSKHNRHWPDMPGQERLQ